MSAKAPSLFDDFFSEEEKKEELFPDIPHVYDPMQNEENEIKEQEPIVPDIAESEEENLEYDSPRLEIEEKKEEETIEEKPDSKLDKPNFKNTKKPKLELPERNELDQQLLHEIISSDYASFIHIDYPFNPLEIESVSSKNNKIEVESIKAHKKEIFVERADSGVEETNKNEQEQNENNFKKEESEEPFVIPLPDWELTKKYYPIGEVAKLFDVNISQIRFWTNEFQLNPRTTRKGDRLYSPEQINELKLIHYLVKVKKHTIKGAKEKMKTQKETVGSNLKLKESLTELRDLLLNIQNTL